MRLLKIHFSALICHHEFQTAMNVHRWGGRWHDRHTSVPPCQVRSTNWPVRDVLYNMRTILLMNWFRYHVHPERCRCGITDRWDNYQYPSVHWWLSGKRQNLVPHINKDVIVYRVLCYILQLLSLCWSVLPVILGFPWYFSALDVSESEIFLFRAVDIQMEHDMRDNMKYHWFTTECFFSPFYGKTEIRQIFSYS
jgi:hypothetical protein